MEWNDLTSTTATKTTRQKLYRFLLGRPEATRDLLRHLTENEAADLLDLLIQCDNRRVAAVATPKRKTVLIDEMDAILLG